ncbi:MAG: ribulose 1,5-bisphosphate carboxylase large subunit, partial [Chloroflexi bacterium]|nr:ribulose 1,5-bisphosphate carboxylase large subunit [Chloroflexota bacterium]
MTSHITLSGERFSVVYHLTGTEAEARAKAADICLEQTVELPDDLLTGDIRGQIVGRIVAMREMQQGVFEAAISFAVETVGGELTQLLNVI